jgi:peptidyl-prolyl cis-trans isomerase SurA
MKTKLVFFILLFFSVSLIGQNNKVLLKIDDHEIFTDEFLRIYKKNNENAFDQKSINDYLELFINYKLKVIEAENLKLDTTKAFIEEFNLYKSQLEEPYLVTKNYEERLVKEAYERMKSEVNVSHILIKVSEDASPTDTITAYKKALEVRKRLLKGEKFEDVARSVSDDPSVVQNGGYLGYFTVFQMIYPFESACYSLKKDEISMPVRTKFGYHIIKLNDKRPASGQVRVAHIMIVTPSDAPEDSITKAKNKIDSIYQRLLKGENFEELAKKYSDDRNSARNGGILPWFGAGRMVESFEEAAFALKKQGDISPVIRTPFGFHIIKLIDKKEIGTFDEVKESIIEKVNNDERNKRKNEFLLADLKKEFNFKEELKNVHQFYYALNENIFKNEWHTNNPDTLNKIIFSFADKNITQKDFLDYILSQAAKTSAKPIIYFVDNCYNDFVLMNLKNYKRTLLPQINDEFRYLLQEYHDGILLFELTDSMVWSKAVKDTLGLKEYYEKIKNNYMWNDRALVSIYKTTNEKTAKKTLSLVKKRYTKNSETNESILKKINTIKDSVQLTIETIKVQKGENKIVDSLGFKPSVSKIMQKDNNFVIYYIEKIIPSEPKKLDEIKGLAIADYQNYLEEQWIKELRNKHKIVVNKEVLSSLKE